MLEQSYSIKRFFDNYHGRIFEIINLRVTLSTLSSLWNAESKDNVTWGNAEVTAYK